MKLSKTSAHAALAVAFLATRRNEGPIQARHVAEHLGVPTDSALKILQSLVRHKLIQSQLGRCGGYLMHLDPQQLTLLQIVEAIDGPIVGDLPSTAGGEHIEPGLQVLANACKQAAEHLRKRLSRHTIAELAQMDNTPLAIAG